MTTISLAEAQANLPVLIEQLAKGEEFVITRDTTPVAKLSRPTTDLARPVFGSGKGNLIILSDDREHLADFEEYMP